MTRRAGSGVVALAACGLAFFSGWSVTRAAAHHVGAYTARDNEVSASFKQIKFSIQARKFDVALRLFDTGPLGREMAAQAARLPAGLEASTRAALQGGDGKTAELDLAVFFAALARDLALEAERKLSGPGASDKARAAMGAKFLEAIWRYYNLVDFTISEHDSRTAVAVRLSFEDAEGYTKASGRAAPPPDPRKMRAPLQRLARILDDFIRSATPTRRDS
jgi:hypothetical protein